MKTAWHIIGLMSGSSLDGIDLAAVTFDCPSEDDTLQWKITHCTTIPYASTWMEKLQGASVMSGKELWHLHQSLGAHFAECCQSFIRENNLSVDAIASHGHTVFHEPASRFTCQIGCGGTMAALLEKPVIVDFRSTDIALGGQGAPLAPLADRHLFPATKNFLNLGGIANVSIFDGTENLAYDVTGCNQWLNYFAQKCGKPFDEDGALAQCGTVYTPLLSSLNTWPFYQERIPKSLSNQAVIKLAKEAESNFSISPQDYLATFTEHIAEQLAQAFHASKNQGPILVTGGGAHNSYLIEKLNKKLHSDVSLHIPSPQVIDYKEAALIALAGLFRLHNKPIFDQALTGAARSVSGGGIYQS